MEPPYRGRGLAGALLQTVCREMQALGEPTLYLLTDHTRFYERYGWQYLCMVQADGDPAPCRVYVHTENWKKGCANLPAATSACRETRHAAKGATAAHGNCLRGYFPL